MDLLQGDQSEIWAQSDPPPVDLSVGDIRSQIAAEWLQGSVFRVGGSNGAISGYNCSQGRSQGGARGCWAPPTSFGRTGTKV